MTFSLLLESRSQQFLLPLHLLTFAYSSQTPFRALTSRRPTTKAEKPGLASEAKQARRSFSSRMLAGRSTEFPKHIPHSRGTLLRFGVYHFQHEGTERIRNPRIPVEIKDRV